MIVLFTRSERRLYQLPKIEKITNANYKLIYEFSKMRTIFIKKIDLKI